MMKDTGYINATKLCSSGGREYKKWSRLNGSQELIQAIETDLALENTASTVEKSEGQIWPPAFPACKIIVTANYTEVLKWIA